MNIKIKAISVIALLTAVSSSVWAERPQHGGQHQRPSFSTIDVNGDGTIEIDEFSTQDLPNGDYETVFSHIDSNSDGVISEDEFENHEPPRRSGKKERKND